MKEYKLKINGEIDFIIISPQVLSSLISQILLLKRVIMKLMGNVMHIHIFSLYTYNDMDEVIDVCVKNMVNEDFTEE